MDIQKLFAPKSKLSILADRSFKGQAFEDMSLHPPFGSKMVIKNVEFQNCKVSPGTCFMGLGVELDGVVFDGFECGDALETVAESIVGRVIVRGMKRPKMLWIKPSGESPPTWIPPSGAALDISDYVGEVSVTGIPLDQILTNPSEHVGIQLKRFYSVKWESLDINELSYWRLMAKKVQLDGGKEGVFSMPLKSSKRYRQSMKEYEVLRGAGVI